MTTYTDVFGGANIYPSDVSYSALALAGADVQLAWPLESSAGAPYATRIIDVSSDIDGRGALLPAATGASPGETVLFNNVGSHSVLIKNAAGTQVVSVAPGELWQVYLTNNATAAGAWETLQYGSTVSNANASALAGTGLVAIGTTLSQSMPVFTINTSYAAGPNDRSTMLLWTGASGTVTLPDPTTLGNNWFISVRNSGTGSLVLDPAGSVLIDGAASKNYQPGESSTVVTDGTAYYSVGYGKSATFAFDYTSVAVAGAGTYTLSGSELNRIAYTFTGALTGDRTVVVPPTVQQYWITNSTTGPYTLTVKTAAGTGVTIAQGQSAIAYSNGINVVYADTAGVTTPISVAEGGTGATTASAARVNLGATSVGNAVFTAANAGAARTALGAGTTGDALFVAADMSAAWAALGPVNGGEF